MKKVVVIDGRSGRTGQLFIERIKAAQLSCEIIAIGTNAIATSAMLKAGAEVGATGENPVIVACRSADVIAGPIGIVWKDAMMGEITGRMAAAVAEARAERVLVPVLRCSTYVAGTGETPLQRLLEDAADRIVRLVNP